MTRSWLIRTRFSKPVRKATAEDAITFRSRISFTALRAEKSKGDVALWYVLSQISYHNTTVSIVDDVKWSQLDSWAPIELIHSVVGIFQVTNKVFSQLDSC